MRVSIRYHLSGEAVPWVQVLVVELRDLGSRDRFLAGQEDGSPRTPMVDDGQYAVIASAFRESSDQIHSHLGERGVVGRYRNFVQGGLRPVCEILVLLTDCVLWCCSYTRTVFA